VCRESTTCSLAQCFHCLFLAFAEAILLHKALQALLHTLGSGKVNYILANLTHFAVVDVFEATVVVKAAGIGLVNNDAVFVYISTTATVIQTQFASTDPAHTLYLTLYAIFYFV